MKKLAVALLALLVLTVGALLAAPSFWDWNAEKGRMAALVKEHTGRDLEIVGDVSLRLLPRPAFAARQVTLANLPGGSEPAMASLDELTVSIAPLPLLRGEVLVESVTLVKPDILLEVLEDGRANWRLAAAAPATGEGAPGVPPRPAADTRPIRIDSFLVEDGRVRYRDARSGRQETLENIDAELAAGSLAGPFAAEGTAVYEDVPLAFDASLGQLVEGGATATSLSLRLPQAGASATFVGALSRHAELQTLRGRLQATGGDLAAVVNTVAAGAVAPARLAQPFSLAAEVSADDSKAVAEGLKLTLGSLSLDGRLAADLTGAPDVDVRLAAKTVDLDALLAPAAPAPGEGPAPAGGAGDPTARGPAGKGAATLPTGFSASVELTAEALLYRGQTVRQLRLAGRLEDGRIDVSEATVQLPGSSDVAVTGRISSDQAGPRFAGKLSAESDNLRGLLRWLDSDIEAVPAERLRRLALTTRVEAGLDQVVLRDTDLRLDVSRMTGGAAIALRERPGLGIALSIDKLNLDAYLPKQNQTEGPPATAAPGEAQPPAGAAPAAARDPLAVPLLGRFDANLDLRVGQLTYQGLPLNGLQLDATLQQGGLVVRQLSVADLVGSRGRFAGSVANIDRSPSIDGSIDVSVATLSRLVKVLGVSTGGLPPLESFTLSGAVNGNSKELRFDQRLAALGGTLRASGRAALPPGAPQVDAALALDHPDLTVLLSELLRDPAVPAGLGPAVLEGRLAAGDGSLELAGLKGKVAGVELLDGTLGVATAGPRPRITAALSAGAMPLAALLAPAAGTAAGTGAGGGMRGGAPAAARERWSHKPLDLAALRAVDADVRMTAKILRTDKLQLADAALELQLTDGLLELTRFTADGYGGKVSLTGRADARDAAAGLQLSGDLSAQKVELKGLLRDLADSERFSGPVTLQSRLASRGASEAALVSSLAGDGKLSGTVTVTAKVEEQAGALVLDILGQKVREVRGITDSTTMLFGAFAGAPATIDGSFLVKQGVARSEDLTMRGRDAVARTEGSVDLPDWRLDSVTNVYRDVDPQTAYLTAKLRGPLDEPNVALGGQPFQRRQETPEPSPGPSPVPDSGTGAEQPQPLKPEELLKDGLKNLLKGLGG